MKESKCVVVKLYHIAYTVVVSVELLNLHG